MSHFLDVLDAETRKLQLEADGAHLGLLGDEVAASDYREFLAHTYGFLRPLELSLLETTGLDRVFDPRRLGKHQLLSQDLATLGMKRRAIEALPQCMTIPLFETIHEALGWAFIVERSTLAHAALFRNLAGLLPGEAAFASSYLKCYDGVASEMWRRFGACLDAVITDARQAYRLVDGAKASFAHHRRWHHPSRVGQAHGGLVTRMARASSASGC